MADGPPPLIDVLKAERDTNLMMIQVYEKARDTYLRLSDEDHIENLVSSYEMHYRSVFTRGLVNWLSDLIEVYDV